LLDPLDQCAQVARIGPDDLQTTKEQKRERVSSRLRLTSEYDPQETCVRNLVLLDQAARSYALSVPLSRTSTVAPSDLWGVFPTNYARTCPARGSRYAPFVVLEGPACPDIPAHTEAFRPWRAAWTNFAFYRKDAL
jgi:hypothetical protein